MWQNKKETLLRAEDIETLESYIDAFDGYFGKMAAYLDEFVANGIAKQSFTEEEVRADLEVALWYSYAELILILMRATILLCNGAPFGVPCAGLLACGITGMPARCCIAVN